MVDRDDDEKLLEDLSSALLSEHPEEQLQFTPVHRGLGFHHNEPSKGFSRVIKKPQPVEFRIHDSPPDNRPSPRRAVPSAYVWKRGTALVIDTFFWVLTAISFYAVSLLVLLGEIPLNLKLILQLFSSPYWGYLVPIALTVWFCYAILFQTVTGASIGKLLMGLRLEGRNGGPIDWIHLLSGRARVVEESV